MCNISNRKLLNILQNIIYLYLSHRIIDSFPRKSKWKIKILILWLNYVIAFCSIKEYNIIKFDWIIQLNLQIFYLLLYSKTIFLRKSIYRNFEFWKIVGKMDWALKQKYTVGHVTRNVNRKSDERQLERETMRRRLIIFKQILTFFLQHLVEPGPWDTCWLWWGRGTGSGSSSPPLRTGPNSSI